MGKESDPKDVWDKLTYDQRLAATAVIFEAICKHARHGGSCGYLIYDRLGFNDDAYLLLSSSGGWEISNNFDLSG